MFMGEGPPRLRPPQTGAWKHCRAAARVTPAPPDQTSMTKVARVWMDSWLSTGLEDASDALLEKLRARVPMEVEKGWSLYVADDNGKLAAMLAMHVADCYLDQLFVAPEYQGNSLGRQCSPLRANNCQMKSGCAACQNQKAWRWYEREGFVFEKEQTELDQRPRHEILSMAEIGVKAIAWLAGSGCTL